MTIHAPWYASATPGTPFSFNLPVARKNNPSLAIAYATREPARISPLLQPNVEIMMAIAIIQAPLAPNTAESAAVATRSSGAFWICASGSAHRYARFARQYSVITMTVPNAIESATSRFGFFTSAAVNPMLFHASAENSEPTCATPKATSNPNHPEAADTVGSKLFRKFAPGSIGCSPRTCQKYEKLSAIAVAFLATNTQSKINPSSASIFAEVKIF